MLELWQAVPWKVWSVGIITTEPSGPIFFYVKPWSAFVGTPSQTHFVMRTKTPSGNYSPLIIAKSCKWMIDINLLEMCVQIHWWSLSFNALKGFKRAPSWRVYFRRKCFQTFTFMILLKASRAFSHPLRAFFSQLPPLCLVQGKMTRSSLLMHALLQVKPHCTMRTEG